MQGNLAAIADVRPLVCGLLSRPIVRKGEKWLIIGGARAPSARVRTVCCSTVRHCLRCFATKSDAVAIGADEQQIKAILRAVFPDLSEQELSEYSSKLDLKGACGGDRRTATHRSRDA